MAPKWGVIRRAYINGKGTYSDLAMKYGVSRSMICRKAKEENWVKLKQEAETQIDLKVDQKTVEKTAEAVSDKAAAEARIRLKLTLLVEKWVDSQKEIADAGEFRKIVQSCVDLGMVNTKDTEQDTSGGGVVMMPGMDASLLDD